MIKKVEQLKLIAFSYFILEVDPFKVLKIKAILPLNLICGEFGFGVFGVLHGGFVRILLGLFTFRRAEPYVSPPGNIRLPMRKRMFPGRET